MDAMTCLPMNVYMRDQYTLKKSNLLIEKINTFSFNTHKIFNLILWEFQHQAIPAVSVKIPVHKLVELVGQKEVYRTKLFYQKIAKNLVQKTLDLIEPTDHAVDITNLISRFTLEKGMVEIRVTDEFLQLVDIHKIAALEKQQEREAKKQEAVLKMQGKKFHLLPKAEKKTIAKYGYTKINLAIINGLKSKHSMMLYEYLLMKLNFHTFKRYDRDQLSMDIDVNTLRKMLCHHQKSYESFDLFRRKILKPALDEINQKTDLLVDVDLVKHCKKVQAIHFSIRKKEDVLLQLNGVSGVMVPDLAQQEMMALQQTMVNNGQIHPSQLPPTHPINRSAGQNAMSTPKPAALKNFNQNTQKNSNQGFTKPSTSFLDETSIENEGLRAAILELKQAPDLEKQYQEATLKHQKTIAEHPLRMARINEAKELGVSPAHDLQDAFQPINGILARFMGEMTHRVKAHEDHQRAMHVNAEVDALKDDSQYPIDDIYLLNDIQPPTQPLATKPSRSQKRRQTHQHQDAENTRNQNSAEALPFEQDPAMHAVRESALSLTFNTAHTPQLLNDESNRVYHDESIKQRVADTAVKKHKVHAEITHQETGHRSKKTTSKTKKLEVQAEGVMISDQQSTRLRYQQHKKVEKYINDSTDSIDSNDLDDFDDFDHQKYQPPLIVSQMNAPRPPVVKAVPAHRKSNAQIVDVVENAYLEHCAYQIEIGEQIRAKAKERAKQTELMARSPAARLAELNAQQTSGNLKTQTMEQVFLSLCVMKQQAAQNINAYQLPDDVLNISKYELIAQAKDLNVLREKVRNALWLERKKCVKAIAQGETKYLERPPSIYHLQYNYEERVNFGFNSKVFEVAKQPYHSVEAIMTRVHENEVNAIINQSLKELKQDLDNYQYQMFSAKSAQELDPQKLAQAHRVLSETYGIKDTDLHAHAFPDPERRLVITYNIMKDQYSLLSHQDCKRLAIKIFNDTSNPQLNDPFATRHHDHSKSAHESFEKKMNTLPLLKDVIHNELRALEERKLKAERYAYFQYGIEQPWHIFHTLWEGSYELLKKARIPNMESWLRNVVIYFENDQGHPMLSDEEYKYNDFNNPTVYVKLPANSQKIIFTQHLADFFKNTLAKVGVTRYHLLMG